MAKIGTNLIADMIIGQSLMSTVISERVQNLNYGYNSGSRDQIYKLILVLIGHLIVNYPC